MIAYPQNWRSIGLKIETKQVEGAVRDCVRRIGVRDLSLSGGVDSSLLLYFMRDVLSGPLRCFTISSSKDHPDFIHSKKVADNFGAEFVPLFVSEWAGPDEIVREFYRQLSNMGVAKILAGDGIDEFAAGYYPHQDSQESTYIAYLRGLNPLHLTPLSKNSGSVEVFLPYLDGEVTRLLSLIPLKDKVDKNFRKKIVLEMAAGKVPIESITRWKYGFCDASHIKENL